MKLITLIAFLILIAVNIPAQNQDFDENMTMGSGYNPPYSPYSVTGSWFTLPQSPIALSRSCVAYVVVNGIPYLYQFGGGDTSPELKRVARLNLNTGSWQNNYSTMPREISSGTAIVMNNGTIYVFGGNSSPGSLGRTLKYNVGSNTWSTEQNMDTRITDALVVKYNETKIFVIGGGDGFFGASSLKTDAVQVYDTQNDTYSYSTDYPIDCSMLGGGIYRDTIIAVGGYTNGGNATANCYKGVINPNTLAITWFSMPSYPAGPITRMASFVAVRGNGVGIMCTGGAVGGSIPTSATNFWNFCTQSWVPGLPNNMLGRSNYKASGDGGSNIYTASGYTTIGVGMTEYISFSEIEGPCQNMVGINGNNSIPASFELKQNYPNPFNPQTNISFSLPEGGLVKIVVSDIQGREVAELTNKLYNAGNHSITFSADKLSSGIYFYTITAGQYNDTKKMLLVK
jgi:hypothetical protein